jgi:acetylornithine deacetylase/succinyl-diaminopimelate desuccinylase-like protein
MSTDPAGLAHWRRLRGPRPAGSPAAARARAYCADVLRGAGYAVSEQVFEFSRVPGAYFTPALGLIVIVTVTRAFFVSQSAAAWLPLAGVLTGLVLIALAASLCAGDGVLTVSAARSRAVNLEATRGASRPRVWLVAHVDSKWQPVSTFWRTAGFMLAGIALAGVTLLAIARLAQGHAPDWWRAPLVLGWAGGLLLLASIVGERGPGALDNASGVAAVLGAAELLPEACDVGVLITDAEELGLAGARAWARAWREVPGIALNCDSVDDVGQFTLMFSGRAAPAQPTQALRRAAAATGQPARAVRLLPGVLTDSVALAARGWQTVTLSRGTLRTLSRVHTMSDDDAHMKGSGIPAAVQVLVLAATELC